MMFNPHRRLLIVSGIIVLLLIIAQHPAIVAAKLLFLKQITPFQRQAEVGLAQKKVRNQKALGHLGAFAKWSKVEIEMIGPPSQGTGTPNPFSIFVDVIFTSPSGETIELPGFYDGDGNGGLDGDLWKVRFSADEVGTWTFQSSSANSQLNGYTGTFSVSAIPLDAPGFFKLGRLESVGTPDNQIRYLKFRDGAYWLKAGSDDPEGFLSPTLEHYSNNGLRQQAIAYWASKGINSLYIMTHKIDGDQPTDVYPWLGETANEAKSNAGSDARFDLAKLEEWREIFEYMNEQGVVPVIVLEDDSAWTGHDYPRYYRELIARFGYLPALLFNYAEEYNERHTLAEALADMQLLKDIDPYDHPRGIHNLNDPNNDYIDAEQIDLISIQSENDEPPAEHNQRSLNWINLAINRNQRVPMVGFDEARPSQDRKSWWSVYMGGGVWESIWGKAHWTSEEELWTELGGARTFMESLPFWEMAPMIVPSGSAFALVKPASAYALYLPQGGTVEVELATDVSYDYAWWNPSNGKDGSFQNSGTTEGGSQAFTAPSSGDWALRIVSNSGTPTSTPMPTMTTTPTTTPTPPTATPTPDAVLFGSVTLQGRPEPPHPRWVVPLTVNYSNSHITINSSL